MNIQDHLRRTIKLAYDTLAFSSPYQVFSEPINIPIERYPNSDSRSMRLRFESACVLPDDERLHILSYGEVDYPLGKLNSEIFWTTRPLREKRYLFPDFLYSFDEVRTLLTQERLSNKYDNKPSLVSVSCDGNLSINGMIISDPMEITVMDIGRFLRRTVDIRAPIEKGVAEAVQPEIELAGV